MKWKREKDPTKVIYVVQHAYLHTLHNTIVSHKYIQSQETTNFFNIYRQWLQHDSTRKKIMLKNVLKIDSMKKTRILFLNVLSSSRTATTIIDSSIVFLWFATIMLAWVHWLSTMAKTFCKQYSWGSPTGKFSSRCRVFEVWSREILMNEPWGST